MGENIERQQIEFENRKNVRQRVKDYIFITIASFFHAMGVSMFSDANNLVPGGVSGIAILLNNLFGLGTGTWFFILNVPIMLLGLWKFGFKFILSTMYCIVMTSLFTNMLAPFGAATNDLLLASLGSSVLMAVTMGVIFQAGATTGGSDIIIKLLRLRFPYIKTGMLFFLMDLVIVGAAAVVFKDVDAALYSLICVVVTSLVLDVVLYGRDEAKVIYIISDNADSIAKRLLEELDLGVTFIHGEGAYSGNKKKVIMVAVKKMIAPRTETIVREEDPDAFMIVTSATEIFGEGYKSYFSEKL